MKIDVSYVVLGFLITTLLFFMGLLIVKVIHDALEIGFPVWAIALVTVAFMVCWAFVTTHLKL
jgi:hypothetical protein